MSYFLHTDDDRRAMLDVIGVRTVDELFSQVPAELQLARPLKLPPALSELELTQHLAELAASNASPARELCFLGGGAYDHFIPAVVDHVAGRSEFYTSYTPYQPEASQGNLQVFFEYQTLICQLTGMDVSNASLYDGGSAVAEAVLMARSITNRPGRVVTIDSVHPEYRRTLETYLRGLDCELTTVPARDGTFDPDDLKAAVGDDTACVVVEQPNFFGQLEPVAAAAEIAHRAGALFVVSVDPISLGLLRRPGDYGADIVVAEGQSLGSPLAYGGPYLGILACRQDFVRRIPGRITGETVDRHGRRCYVLTLQTREQHIRREKATSNICTNQGLFALRAAVYLATLGPRGLAQVAELCLQKAHYAAELVAGERLSLAFERPFFKEFVVRDRQGQVAALLAEARAAGILAGVPLGTWYPDLADCFLVAVTEKRTRAEIDRWAATLSGAGTREAVFHA